MKTTFARMIIPVAALSLATPISATLQSYEQDEVYQIATTYIERARAGGGPALIEAKTYRKGGHSRADPGKYRPEEEVQMWLGRDPVRLYRARLIDAGIEEKVLDDIDTELKAEVDRATQEAKDGAIPGEELIYRDVWADGGSEWRS